MKKNTEDIQAKVVEIFFTKDQDITPLIEMGMNQNSAKDSIKCYSQLIKGEPFRRSIQQVVIKAILKKLYENNDGEKLANVLTGLEKHFEIRLKKYNEKNIVAKKIVAEYKRKLHGHIANKYFAYHGPQNLENFDYKKNGYGVALEGKWNRVNDGDLVYVI